MPGSLVGDVPVIRSNEVPLLVSSLSASLAYAASPLEAALTSEFTVLGALALAIGGVLLTGLRRRTSSPAEASDGLHPAWPLAFLGGGIALVVTALVIHGVLG